MKIFRILQLQIIAFLSYDALIRLRIGSTVFHGAIFQLIFSLLGGIVLHYSFSKRDNLIILIGFIFWQLLPFFIADGGWYIWANYAIAATIGLTTGIFFSRKTIPLSIALFSIGIGTAYYFGKILLQQMTIKEQAITISETQGKFFVQKNLLSNTTLLLKDGQHLNLDTFRNKNIIIDFWFVGCKPCYIKDKPFELLANKYGKDTSIIFIKILSGNITKYDIFKAYSIDSLKNIVSVYDSAGMLSQRLKIDGYPKEYVINAKGDLMSTFTGFAEDFEQHYLSYSEKRIDSLLKK